MKKYLAYGILAAMMASAVPAAAEAAEWHGHPGGEHWHGGHPDAWYFHPHWSGRHYVVAPVPAPVYVGEPYYYVPPSPVYYPPAPVYYPQPGVNLSINR